MSARVRELRPVAPQSVDGRPPPTDYHAEECVIGTVLFDPEYLVDFVSTLRADDFLHPAHQAVARAVHALVDAREAVDVQTVISWCVQHAANSFDDGKHGIPRLVTDLAVRGVVSGVRTLAKRVRDVARLRRGVLSAQRFCAHAYTGDLGEHETVQGLLDATASEFGATAGDAPDAAQSDALTVAKELATSMRDRARNRGLTTGFRGLDAMLAGGPRAGQLVLVAGRTSMGKTAFAMQMVEAAADADAGVLVVQLEMGREELMARQVSSASRVPIAKVRTGDLFGEELTRVSGAMSRAAKLPIVYVDTPGQGILEIRGHAHRARALFRRRGIDLRLVMVDHVGLVKPPTRKAQREQEVSEISRGLKYLAKDLGVPVMALAQLSREAAKKGSGKVPPPSLVHLRESGSLEQDADVVIFVHRPGYYDTNGPQDEAEIIVAKQRNGPTGSLKLGCEMRFVRFFEREGDS